ncbi:MAG: twin-arginine translocase subunit TatC [Gemmatimonadetes bacterium]|nr:twin-arginine translocase subunit TatC [Gemmatimonadota bacterium]
MKPRDDLPGDDPAPLESTEIRPKADAGLQAEPTPPPEESASDMSFLDHLEELRRRLGIVVLSVILGAGIGYAIAPRVFEVAIGRLPESLEQRPLGGGMRAWVEGLRGAEPEPVDEGDEQVAGDPMPGAEYPDAAAAAAALDTLLQQVIRGDVDAGAEIPEAISTLVRAEAEAAVRRALDDAPARSPHDPPAELIVTTPAGAILTKLKLAVFVGIVLSVPVILYQAWMFVAPGLLKNEKRIAAYLVAPTTLCFGLGVYFSYRILPLITAFFSSVSADLGIEQRWIADDYLGFVLKLCLVGGVSFQLPVISYGLASLGVIGPSLLRRYRRIAVVIIFIAAATFTPPDPLSMIFMGVPLLVLYEISIGVAALARRGSEEA